MPIITKRKNIPDLVSLFIDYEEKTRKNNSLQIAIKREKTCIGENTRLEKENCS